MITYIYKCTICEKIIEVSSEEMFGSHERAINCPRCGGLMRKIYNLQGLVFKGKGFYSTDNRRETYESE